MTGNLNLDTRCAAITLAPLWILEQEQIYYCEKTSGALSSNEKELRIFSHDSKFSLAKAAPKSARLGAGCQVPWQVFAQSLPQVSLPLLGPLCSNLLIGHQHHDQSFRLTFNYLQRNETQH